MPVDPNMTPAQLTEACLDLERRAAKWAENVKRQGEIENRVAEIDHMLDNGVNTEGAALIEAEVLALIEELENLSAELFSLN